MAEEAGEHSLSHCVTAPPKRGSLEKPSPLGKVAAKPSEGVS